MNTSTTSSAAINWSSASAASDFGNISVLALHVVAHQPNITASSDVFAPPSPKQPNHWQLFCQVSADHSICIDPSLGNNGRLSMEIERIANVIMDQLVHVKKLLPTVWTTNDLLRLIVDARYDRYKFAESGQGCRYWISCVLELMDSKGFFEDSSAVTDTIQNINVVWKSQNQPVEKAAQTTPERGVFLQG